MAKHFVSRYPDSIRTSNPAAWPQYPYNESPRTPEQSEVRFSILPEYAKRLRLRDGVELTFDVMRPAAPGEKFPALLAWSPYTRQLQYTVVPSGQNEAGLSEFWVPRGYVHVIADVRGSNDSGGAWDHMGPIEQGDLKEMIAFIAQQPWCNGKVGMAGCSYFAWSQLLAAEQQPEGLAAIFPYDAATDMYRDAYFHGGIPSNFGRNWFSYLVMANHLGGRVKDLSGFDKHFTVILNQENMFDGPYYQERSAEQNLHKIKVPTYFGCDWRFHFLHLRGAFSGWQGVPEGTTKRLLMSPHPEPFRPFAAFHFEALRWYDHYLKGMDTGLDQDAPVNLYIQGEKTWRGEKEWPLARTKWTELSLTGNSLTENAGAPGEASYTHVPGSVDEANGRPKLVWRSEPYVKASEITGPVALYLVASSSATDTDWFVLLYDEAPDGSLRLLSRGWLRASHRALDPRKSKPWQPWHPHDRAEAVNPGEPIEYAIEIIPTCNVFLPGHRMRLELASSDNMPENFRACHWAQPTLATNTVYTGRKGSRLLIPMIPR